MPVTANIPQQTISQAQALWVVFKSQPKSVQTDFILLMKEDEKRQNAQETKEHHSCRYSDEELDELLKDCPMVCEDDISELSDEDFHTIAHNMSRKPIRGIEKWL